MNSIFIITLKLFGINILLLAITVYFRLGYQIPIILIVGLVLTMLLTKSDQANLNRQYVAPLFVTVSYLLIFWLTWLIFIAYEIPRTYTQRTHAMTWENKGKKNHTGESEVVFQFVDHPGNYHGVYSNNIAKYLEDLLTPRIDLKFEISRDFGCWNGYRVVQIGGLSQVVSRDGYARDEGVPKQSPWDEFYEKWWFP